MGRALIEKKYCNAVAILMGTLKVKAITFQKLSANTHQENVNYVENHFLSF